MTSFSEIAASGIPLRSYRTSYRSCFGYMESSQVMWEKRNFLVAQLNSEW